MRTPLVSICIPTYNGVDLIGDAVSSALNQDYPAIEVVVADDASDDETVDFLREQFGDAIKLFVNPSQLGQSENSNVSVAHSTGSFVKFLHHDDQLERDCVSKMAAALGRYPSAGLVFSRRRIALSADTSDARGWIEEFGEIHRGFRSLGPFNDGTSLMKELVEGDLQNWIGEPSAVMVRRACLERVGGFHCRISLLVDLELWLRVMARYDVAFIDEELVAYRHSPGSLTAHAYAEGRNWLDRLWILESLMADRELRARIPEIEPRWRAERRAVFRGVIRSMLKSRGDDPPSSLWRGYLLYRAKLRVLRRSTVIGTVSRALGNNRRDLGGSGGELEAGHRAAD